MKTIELFCGTKSFSKVAQKRGYDIFTVDLEKRFGATITADIRTLTKKDFPTQCDLLWASPPCQGFSVAAIGHNWTGGKKMYIPKSDTARLGIELLEKTISLIDQIKPRYFIIENPRGVMRKMPQLQHLRRVTVTYCQYGDTRMKPTDLWTNIPETIWKPKPPCKNGDKCHVSAPRGSKTGTQGLKGAEERGVIPPELFEEIFNSII